MPIFTSPEILPVIYIYLSLPHTLLPLFPLSLNSLKKFLYMKALSCYLLCFSQLLFSLLFTSFNFIPWYFNFMNKIFNFHIMKYISLFLYDMYPSSTISSATPCIIKVISHSKMKLAARLFSIRI